LSNIRVLPGGPYVIHSDDSIVLIDPKGETRTLTTGPVALCRCGATCNEPFCDGSHARIGFQLSKMTSIKD